MYDKIHASLKIGGMTMELKKCPRCGSFYNSDLLVCQNCKTNENLDVTKLKEYIEQYGCNKNAEEMSIQTGINVKNINRYLGDAQGYGITDIIND